MTAQIDPKSSISWECPKTSPLAAQDTVAIASSADERTMMDHPARSAAPAGGLVSRLLTGAAFSVLMVAYCLVFTAKVTACLAMKARPAAA